MSFLKDNLIVMGPSSSCSTSADAAIRLCAAGYRIGLVDPLEHDSRFAFEVIDPSAPLPKGVVACLSSNADWLVESCANVPHLVLLGHASSGLAKSYPSALSWADDYLAPRVPRITRSQP